MSNIFFVAELSGNHNKSLDIALQLVRAAADAGANAVKLQTYTPDCLTLDSDRPEFLISEVGSLWYGRTLYELYQDAMMPWEFHTPIFEECKKYGMVGFSTPFSEKAVDFLESVGNPIYKIASFEINHLPLIQKINVLKKPVIASTGVATAADIRELTYQLRYCPELTLLKCTSEYPAVESDANLREMVDYSRLYDCSFGLSDHSMTHYVPMAAAVLGATVIEKHIKLSADSTGVDAGFSITPEQFKEMVVACKTIRSTLQSTTEKKGGSKYRRSLYISKDIKKGEIFTEDNIRVVRPNLGCAPFAYNIFLGKAAKDDYAAGTPTHYGMIDYA